MNTLPTILIDIENLLPLPKNAKKHTAEQVENIKNSIKSFGFNDPLGIWQNKKLKKEGKYYVVTGNGTLDACKELEITQIPCNDLSNLSENEMRAYAIAHNATTLKTGFDYGILEMELSELDFDFSDFGLDKIDIFDGNIDDFFGEDDKEKEAKIILCPHCGKDINSKVETE